MPEGIAHCRQQAAPLVFDTVIASDLARARMAADAIAQDRTLTRAIDPRWRELHFGQWENALPDGLSLEALHRDPDAHAPPGGERWSDLRKRVAAALDDLAGATLVVTHVGAIRAALAVLLDLEYRQCLGIALPYAALVSLRVWPGEFAEMTGLKQ
jgi:alpha-ribazole phosphatase